jgi:hypothetical protein
MEHVLRKIDAQVPWQHGVRAAWDAWHATLLYDRQARAHLPRVCASLFAPYRREPWAARVFGILHFM